MNTKNFSRNSVVALAFGAVLALAPACGSSNSNPKPSNPVGGSGGVGGSSNPGSGGTANPGTGGTANPGTGGSNPGTGGANSTGGAAGAAGAAGSGGNCTGTDGCYSCTPTTNDQFLNACTTADCAPFDNSTLSMLGPSGQLPPLP
jgi:hypothetical protein